MLEREIQFSTVWNPIQLLKQNVELRSNAAHFKDLTVSYENHKRSNAGFSAFILKTSVFST